MKAIHLAIQSRTPTLVWGAPGIGKSSGIMALGEALGLNVEVVISSIREPADFTGLPVVREGGVRIEPPAWARRLSAAGKGILFLDEITTAPPAVQAALLRVVLDRVVGDLELPDGVVVVAAANPPEQAAGGWDLSAPLANRFVHLDWELNTSRWVDGMINGWRNNSFATLPEGWESGFDDARLLVASFIRARPELLLRVPSGEAIRAWPSPRSWEMAARLLAACKAAKADDATLAALVTGAVGEGAGMEFLAWVRELDLPDPESLLAAPDKFTLPKRGDQAFAVLSSVANAAIRNLTAERWAAAWAIMAHAAEQGGRDIAAAAVKTLASSRRGMPLPVKELKPFVELLKAGGML